MPLVTTPSPQFTVTASSVPSPSVDVSPKLTVQPFCVTGPWPTTGATMDGAAGWIYTAKLFSWSRVKDEAGETTVPPSPPWHWPQAVCTSIAAPTWTCIAGVPARWQAWHDDGV